MANYSQSEENYIKAIYHLQTVKEPVNTNDLAEYLKAKPASITDMLKKLKQKKLITYTAYYGCSLTTTGKSTAIQIIRRHRLWEYFLSEKLGFSWDEVHDVAEELEHVSNEKLVTKLDAFLGFPKFDPHGDPIPNNVGIITTEQQTLLSEIPETQSGTVTQIVNQSKTALEMLKNKGISIGTVIKVIQKFPFDQSMEIKAGRQNNTLLTRELAKNIYIKSL